MPRRRTQRGQASVELVALLPLIALVTLIGWQLVVAGQAVWLSASAARSAARAAALGADPAAAARRALPTGLRAGVRVRREHDGVRVWLAVPAVVHGVRLGSIAGRASFPSQGAG
jgi:uncharacterized protein (UPF0333 family)